MMLKLLLSGDGGQGVQAVADVLSQAALKSGLEIMSIPNYGLEQRGGISLVFIKISDKEIGYPKFTTPDILLILSDQARLRTEQYQHSETKILDVKDCKEIMTVEKISSRSLNVFFLGILAKILADKKVCEASDVAIQLEKKLSKKIGWEENKKAFEIGLNL
jgi:2-oxoglutarate ferredoxin oxidoreductase subunit gamma